MNAHVKNKDPMLVYFLMSIVLIGLLLLTIPVQQLEEAKAVESIPVPVLFSESGTVEFLNPQYGYPVLETLSPADLGIEIEETQAGSGYRIINNNDKFVLLMFSTFDNANEALSKILGAKESMEITPKDVAISMSFPNRDAIIGSPGNWVFQTN